MYPRLANDDFAPVAQRLEPTLDRGGESVVRICPGAPIWILGMKNKKSPPNPKDHLGKQSFDAYFDFRLDLERRKRRLGITHKHAWFRGQINGKAQGWMLSPTLIREFKKNNNNPCLHILKREEDLYNEFCMHSNSNSLSSIGSSWVKLSEMTHYRVPTRMLDWTKSILVALYFAIETYIELLEEDLIKGDTLNDQPKLDSEFNPVIYVLSPYRLSEASEEKYCKLFQDSKKILSIQNYPDLDYFQCHLRNNGWPFQHPIPIIPPWENQRILAQKGFFTFHGNDEKALDDQFTKNDGIYSSVEIPIDAIQCILILLIDSDINKYEIYRDLDTLAHYLRRKYF